MGHDIWFNGKLIPFEDAKIHVLSHVIHYGTSVFEGIRVYDPEKGPAVFRLPEHIRRLYDSAKIYRMVPDYSQENLCAVCRETVDKNGLTNGYIRPMILRGYGSPGIDPQHLSQIFDLGWSTKKGEGMGFGLFWTKDYIEGLGGRIAVESARKQGTTFIIHLPVASA